VEFLQRITPDVWLWRSAHGNARAIAGIDDLR
jgi:hypothetical protein